MKAHQKKTRFFATAAAIALAAGAAGAAQAQPGAAEAPMIGEIVVTAQKRAEMLQDVPLSITAISGETIEREGITSFQEYATRVPNLAFAYASSIGPSAQSIALRGIFGGGTTGFYLDETPLPGSLDPQVVDLQRIEVLRGPQGTLYGARSMGGTVRLITTQPDQTESSAMLHAVGSVTSGGGENGAIDGTVNIKVIDDKLAVRIFAFGESESGFLDRVASPSSPTPFATHEDVNSTQRYGGQLSAKLSLMDGKLTITPRALFQRYSADGRQLADIRAGNTTLLRMFDVDEPVRDDFELYTLTAQYAAPFGDFTSATSQFKRRFSDLEDFSEMADFLLGIPQTRSVVTAHGDVDAFSQEFRFSSSFEGPLQFTVGAFYQRSETFVEFPPIVVGPIDNLFSQVTNSEVTEKALFGEATWALTDKLDLIAGVRLFDNEVVFTGGQDGIAVIPISFDGSQNEKGVNPKFGVRYKLNEDAMLFATAAKGFRIGGVNAVAFDFCAADLAALGISQADARTFDSDSLWSYEAGAKTSWFGNRLQANATAFHIDWKNVQQGVGLGGCGFSLTQNAGEATSDGVELELQARPTAGLTLSGGAGFTEAKITDTGGLLSSRVGAPIQQVPKWTANLAADYEFELGDTPMFAHADYSYVGSSASALNNAANPRLRKAYSLANARIGVRIGKIEGALFVQNLFDEAANLSDAPSLGLELPGRPRIVINRPRTVGVDVRARF